MPVKPIPDGYHSITPYLIVHNASQALDFYKKAFGAEELFRMPTPDGKKIAHSEFRIGDSAVMLADEAPEMKVLSPKTIGGTPTSLYLYVPDVDKTFAQAVAAGATVEIPLQDKFYGDRNAIIVDPFGHRWGIATHKEDLTPEEVEKRAAKAFPK